MVPADKTDAKGVDGIVRPKDLSGLPQGQWWDHLNTEVIEYLRAKGFSRHVNRNYQPPKQPGAMKSQRSLTTIPTAPSPLSADADPTRMAAYNIMRKAFETDLATWHAESKMISDEESKVQRAQEAFDKYDAEVGKALGILGSFYGKTQWDSVKRHELFTKNPTVVGALDASEVLFQRNTQSGNKMLIKTLFTVIRLLSQNLQTQE